MKTKRLFFAYLLLLVVGGLGLWYVPKPWNLDIGILFVLFSFALPDWIDGVYSGRFLRNEAGQFEWVTFQFIAWYSVVIGGLMAFEVIRLKAGIINPLSLAVDQTFALLLGTSASVLLARGLKVRGIRGNPKAN